MPDVDRAWPDARKGIRGFSRPLCGWGRCSVPKQHAAWVFPPALRGFGGQGQGPSGGDSRAGGSNPWCNLHGSHLPACGNLHGRDPGGRGGRMAHAPFTPPDRALRKGCHARRGSGMAGCPGGHLRLFRASADNLSAAARPNGAACPARRPIPPVRVSGAARHPRAFPARSAGGAAGRASRKTPGCPFVGEKGQPPIQANALAGNFPRCSTGGG
jgi:hypothetical protein